MSKRYDLEDRLINFASEVIKLSAVVAKIPPISHLSKQISRSGTSPALNYGEAQGAESKKDFIHKLSIGLKELRETKVCLLIIQKSGLLNNNHLPWVMQECEELTAIFYTSIRTTKSKL